MSYFRARGGELGELPSRTRERCWVDAARLDDVALINEELRPLLAAALRD